MTSQTPPGAPKASQNGSQNVSKIQKSQLWEPFGATRSPKEPPRPEKVPQGAAQIPKKAPNDPPRPPKSVPRSLQDSNNHPQSPPTNSSIAHATAFQEKIVWGLAAGGFSPLDNIILGSPEGTATAIITIIMVPFHRPLGKVKFLHCLPLCSGL